jgi:hypothetical protein
MAVVLLLLAIVGAVLVGDLVVENTAAGGVIALQHSITGYSEGQLLAMAAALGFVLGLLVVGSVRMRRPRRGSPPTAAHGRTGVGRTRARQREPARGAGPP